MDLLGTYFIEKARKSYVDFKQVYEGNVCFNIVLLTLINNY